jgi:hypothetical protein
MMVGMTFETALQAAERLAASSDVELGSCLFSDPLNDEIWGFSFAILDGPSDWSWTIIVSAEPTQSRLLALSSISGFTPKNKTAMAVCWGAGRGIVSQYESTSRVAGEFKLKG